MLAWEKRIFYYPLSNLLVTLGGDRDKVTLRRVDIADQLDKSGVDYLAVLSRPPAAKAGTIFSYKVDIRSKKGSVKVKLESGPKDLKVTPDGQVTWQTPTKPEDMSPDVVLTISDASEQEIFHNFHIDVGE